MTRMSRLASVWNLPLQRKGLYEPLEADMKELPHPSRNLTVSRVVIMVAVAVLVGLLTVSTWYFTHSYPKSAVASLSESLRLEILENTSELLDEIFSMNTYGSMAIANLMEKNFLGDDLSRQSFTKIRDAAWAVFKALPAVTSLGVTAVNGLTAVHNRGHSNEIEGFRGNFCLYSNETGDFPTYYNEFVSEVTGDPLGLPSIERFETSLHETPWFREAVSHPVNNLTWTIGRSQISGQAFVQCAIAKQAKDSKEVALVHSSLSAIAINGFISSLELKGGSLFIADEYGILLFSSEPTVCVLSNRSACETTPLDSNSVLNDGRMFLQSRVGLANLAMNEIHVADVVLKGKRYSVDSWPYSFETVKLSVVVMIPRHSFWGPMDYYTRITWISLPLLSLGVVFIGCSLIYLLVEQVQAEEKLRAEIQRQSEAKCRAEASRDAKTNFLSSMSHELRTPMACIIGLLDMLLMENLTVEHEGSVRQIHRCATSLVSLLNSALDIAKVESGKLVLEMAEFNLEAELTALIDVFSVQCDNKNLFISLDLAETIPTYVVGDSARVMQVFTNLIGNSIKFTSKGRIVVRGRILNLESSNGPSRGHRRSCSPFSLERTTDAVFPDTVVLVFEIDDTGPGIEPGLEGLSSWVCSTRYLKRCHGLCWKLAALREKVFENFVQGNASTTRMHGGTGLGLGIVRSLVNLMGGSIRIVEKPGVGAVFQFSICFQRAATPEALPYNLPPFYQEAEVVIGVPDADTRAAISDWIVKRGLMVHQVETWEQILLHLRAVHGRKPVDKTTGITNMKQAKSSEDVHKYFNNLDSGLDYSPRLSPRNVQGPKRYEFWKSWKNIGDRTSNGQARQLIIIDASLLPKHVQPSDLEEYLQESGFLTGLSSQCLDDLDIHKWDLSKRQHRNLQQKLSVVWVMASNTHEPIKAVLRAVRSSFIVRRPLHAARLKEIFQLVAQDSDVLSSRQSESTPDVLASSTINYVKQQEWDDPYGCDSEVPLAQESSSRPSPARTSNGNKVRHRPTAAKSITFEEISYSEMEIKSSLPTDQTSQSISAPSKSMKRTIRTITHINGSKKPNNAPKPLANFEILIAEDTPLLRKLAAAMLRRLGAVTHEASNGQEVLDAVTNRMQCGQLPFHCILMDCQMPVMDGYEACQAVREAEKDMSWRTSIVALTANAMASDEQKCLKAGMDAFLTKPIDQEYMVQIILQTISPSLFGNSFTSSVKSSVHSEAPIQLQVSS